MTQPTKQNLYRTYRPRFFRELLGQEHISRTLQTAAATNRISHAYLFSGPRGTGKTSTARLLAKVLNCQRPVTPSRGLLDACGVCDACERIDQQTFLDIVEIDGASHTSVDNIRELRENVKYQPAEGKFKVYIIDEVHMLSTAAFNAFLKTLEEPPPKVMFILATTDPQKVPATILSRCQCFDFHPISQRVLLERLVEVAALEHQADPERFPLIGREALALITDCAQGGFRDALSLLDQISSSATGGTITLDQVLQITRRLGFPTLKNLTDSLFNKRPGEVLVCLNDLLGRGYDVSTIGKDLLEHLRRCLLLKIDPDINRVLELPQEQVEAMKSQVSALPLEYLLGTVAQVERSLVALRTSVEPRILLELDLVRLTLREVSLGLEGVERRITQVEQAIASGSRSPAMPSAGGPPQTVSGRSAAPAAGHFASLGGSGPSGTPQGRSGGGVLEKFQDFRSRVAGRNRVLGGLLQGSTLTSFRDGILTLTMDSSFSCKKAQEAKSVEIFQGHLEAVFGEGTRLIVKGPTPEPDASAGPAPAPAGEPESAPPPQGPEPRPDKRGHSQEIARIDKEVRRKVLEKPSIKDALEIFGGDIVSLNRP